uniref:Uncharacterized protein LOC109552772 n=1 Tax=Tursiops truncatus TaxID=9739 RepID=A0A6J3RCD0_TURTR|nr:uncharacterized protein LOC109552772 [Tursiops truncatus]
MLTPDAPGRWPQEGRVPSQGRKEAPGWVTRLAPGRLALDVAFPGRHATLGLRDFPLPVLGARWEPVAHPRPTLACPVPPPLPPLPLREQLQLVCSGQCLAPDPGDGFVTAMCSRPGSAPGFSFCRGEGAISIPLAGQDPSQRPAQGPQWSCPPLPSMEMVIRVLGGSFRGRPPVQLPRLPDAAMQDLTTARKYRGTGTTGLPHSPSHPLRDHGWVSLSPLPRSQAWGGSEPGFARRLGDLMWELWSSSEEQGALGEKLGRPASGLGCGQTHGQELPFTAMQVCTGCLQEVAGFQSSQECWVQLRGTGAGLGHCSCFRRGPSASLV